MGVGGLCWSRGCGDCACVVAAAGSSGLHVKSPHFCSFFITPGTQPIL